MGDCIKVAAAVGGALAIGFAVHKGIEAFEKISEEGSSPAGSSINHPPPQPGDNCPICFDEYRPPLEVLPCKHLFHRQCITLWIREKWMCPICKELIPKAFRREYLERAKEYGY